MSVSFDRWRKAEGRRFKMDLRRLRRGRAAVRQRWWRWPRPRPPRRSTLLILASAGLAAAGVAWTPPPVMVTASGAVTVVDGDTFRIGRETIRLPGIDAPEPRRACADGWQAGEAARDAFVDLPWVGRSSCERVTTDA
jgi:endonuclease YncB( thermonuclease family)